MDAIDNLKRSILEEYDRLGKKDSFKFACHPGVSCYNDCCADVNIFLTPYDIIRMKKHLGISSEEFLAKYTLTPIDKSQRYPVVIMKMAENDAKSCQFVAEQGCTIYPDRPWPCRMYPLGLASPSEGSASEEFYFLMKEDICKGFAEGKEWTVEEWLEDQDINLYNEMGELFKQITLHPTFESGKDLSPEKIEMFHLVCYNIDKFRRFVFESSFLQKFQVDSQTQERIGTDDAELFKFGIEWLKFCIFGERTMKLKSEAEKSAKS